MAVRERKNTKKVFDFKEQLAKGDRGEHFFIHHYHSPIIKYRYHTADFLDWEGNLLELKSDFYSLKDTEFFFMEKYSDVDSRKLGGPWQAHKNGVDKFIYQFVRDGVYFEFSDMEALLERLRELTAGKRLIYIKNKGWRGAGFKIKITDLEDLYEDHRLYYSVDEV